MSRKRTFSRAANFVPVRVALMANVELVSAEKWMREALKEAETAIEEGEVPVGAVFVEHKFVGGSRDLETGSIVSRGHNLTNRTRNVRYPMTI